MNRISYQSTSHIRRIQDRNVTKKARLSLALSFYMITMLFTYVLGLFDNFVKADSKIIPVYVDSRVVKQGETLWSIAEDYKSIYYKNTKEYVEAIKECNNLYSDEIYTGTSLIIPYTE